MARGITLLVPKGDAVRPATDGMRQAVFSSLASRLPGAVVFDLFAGSGSYGLEALSRGAASCCFVEKNHKAAACVKANIEAVCKSIGRTTQGCSLHQADVLTWHAPVQPTLVFVDPPYPIIDDISGPLFERLTRWFEGVADPVVVFEMPGEMSLSPSGWECVHRLGRTGGHQPSAAFFKRASSAPASAQAARE